jgi:hypothetical protein
MLILISTDQKKTLDKRSAGCPIPAKINLIWNAKPLPQFFLLRIPLQIHLFGSLKFTLNQNLPRIARKELDEKGQKSVLGAHSLKSFSIENEITEN